MSDSPAAFAIVFPFDKNTGNVFFGLLAVLALSFVIYLVLPTPELAKRNRNWQQKGIEVLFVFLIPVWVGLMGFILWTLIRLAGRFPTVAESADLRWHALAVVGMMTSLAGLIGTPFVFLRAQTTERHTVATEQGLITDRISKAVEQIGAEKTVKRQRRSKKDKVPRYKKNVKGEPDYDEPLYEELTVPNLEVRIGGLYALESIAKQNIVEHIQIMEILCAYVRENAPVERLEPTEGDFQRPTPRADIQTVIDILGRRAQAHIDHEWKQKFRLNLTKSNLSGVNFSGGNFSAALLNQCRLEVAFFRNATFRGTMLQYSLLNHSDFFQADPTGARLDLSILNRPRPLPGGMNETLGMARSIKGVSAADADLSAVDDFDGSDLTNQIFGSKNTTMCEHFEFDVEKLRILRREVRLAEQNGTIDKIERARKNLDANGFKYWCYGDIHDLSRGGLHSRFLKAMGLQGFPYE